MNKSTSTSRVWRIYRYGSVESTGVTGTIAIRPVIKVKTDLTISGGNGTWNNPYEI